MSKKVILNLVGLDGNAFYLVGAWQKAAKRQGWSQEDISKVVEKATSGNYDHLVKTLIDNTESEDEEEVDED